MRKKATSQERSAGKVLVFPGQLCRVSAEPGLQLTYFKQFSLHGSQLRRAVSLCLGYLLVYRCSSMGCSATLLAFRLPPRQVSVGVHSMSEGWVQKVPWVPVWKEMCPLD